MRLRDILALMNTGNTYIDVYATTDVSWHTSLYMGPAEDCDSMLDMRVVAIFPDEYVTREFRHPMLSIGVA